jgi:hypothetical protein
MFGNSRLPLAMLVGLALAVALGACTTAVLPAPQPAATVASPLATPIASAPVSPLPTVPAPAADSGVAIGRVARLDGTPMREITIYAAVIDKGSNFPVASVDPATDPRTGTDNSGNYVFPKLAPGEYVLVAGTPLGLQLLKNKEDHIIRFEVKAGQVTQIGPQNVTYTYPDGNS